MKLFTVSGEKSGDLHGFHLLKALLKKDPQTTIQGVGGPLTRSIDAFSCIQPMEHFEVMGFTDVLLALPRIVRNFYLVRNQILQEKPSAVLLIDYPGFNLKLAKSLRKKGYQGKIIQYISPTIWAWGPHRIKEMEEILDLLLCIYPFEKDYFKNSSLPVKYIGNPIKEYISNYKYQSNWRNISGIHKNTSLIAFFPGSRKGEIERNLKIQLDVAKELKKTLPDVSYAISCAHPKTKDIALNLLKDDSLVLGTHIYLVPDKFTYELMAESHCALAKSGTVTLELALHLCPTVVMYSLPLINKLYAKHILKLALPHYCIVNILSNHAVFPEFIEFPGTVSEISQCLQSLYGNTEQRRNCLHGCDELFQNLGNFSTSEKAAEAILGC